MSDWSFCPVLGLRDVRAGVDYFVSRLGFEAASVHEGVASDEGAVYGIVRRGGAEIHLQIRRRPLWSAERNRVECDVYARVPDADAYHAELVERGASIRRPPEDQAYGHRDFIVDGPEGHRLVFGSRL